MDTLELFLKCCTKSYRESRNCKTVVWFCFFQYTFFQCFNFETAFLKTKFGLWQESPQLIIKRMRKFISWATEERKTALWVTGPPCISQSLWTLGSTLRQYHRGISSQVQPSVQQKSAVMVLMLLKLSF